MKPVSCCHFFLPLSCLLAGAALLRGNPAQAEERWAVVVSDALAQDEAVKLALADVQEAGTACGLVFLPQDDAAWPDGNVLLVGGAESNVQSGRLAAAGVLDGEATNDDEGYTLQTVANNGQRVLCVAGGSPIGTAYGLYWIYDRLRVYRALPDLNGARLPALKVRVGAAWGRRGHGGNTKAQMRAALRMSLNWVAGPAVLDLVPWATEPENSTNAQHREDARGLIDYAHRLHMKYFSFANEFTFHPSLIQEQGAELSPCDPQFWGVVQEKFRKLFTALLELDGIELCNDDISGFWDNYRAYDLLHETPECEWSYEKRFRTFVQKVHEVVAGEFGKTYFHFTWGLSAHEQHVQPAVFREIFTQDIPTNNLYLVPKITQGDRWWHQAYNNTFNLTPHETIVCFEPMNYYEGGDSNIFPTFSGQYFQRGLQYLLAPSRGNVRGAATLANAPGDAWDTYGAYAYVLYRLMWDPNEDMRQIARDFCAIQFGPEAAETMAELYLMSPVAYKYGLHIEPISYGQFNSFLHMRVGTFPVEGFPTVDGGHEHVEFLREIYLRCDPWREETLEDLNHGAAVTDQMIGKFHEARPSLQPTIAAEVEQRLNMTRLLLATNNAYVRLIFAYFDYLERDSGGKRVALQTAFDNLVAARDAFMRAPGYGYQLFGIDQFMLNAKAALDDVGAAKQALASAPDRVELEAAVARQQEQYKRVLAQYADKAVHFAHFEMLIDGQELLHIAGDKPRVEHLRWDGPLVREMKILQPLPKSSVTVIPKDLYSRPLHPFVLEQPSPENGFTVRIYLDDLPGGQDWFNCDLYYIPEPPEKLGLQPPWGFSTK
ncbi:MAG: hypothetical protein HYZ00_07390 [Candidatus Hydrogenedentes bacterium]|nr:hypothetical protein [Candidatus Hydrogenedentota bacterium]